MRLQRILSVGIALLMLSGVVSSQGSNASEARLRAAMDQETVDGDLDGAMRQYAALAADQKAAERVRAAAFLRLAMAHEKSGSGEANAYYERVLREFPRVTEVVRIASSRLAARGVQTTPRRTTRLLCEGPRSDCLANLSPDGRSLLVYGRGHTGVFVRDLRTGAIRRVAGAPEDAQGLAWSPDGKQIAYGTKSGHTGVVATSGGRGRTLHPNSYPEGWSPDAKRVLVVVRSPDPPEAQLAWVSVADGSVRQLPARVGVFMGVDVSPDGKWITYNALKDLKSAEPTGIVLMSNDGSSEASTWPHSQWDTPIGWSPDGKYFVWDSEDDGVYASRFSDGRLQGSPYLVLREPGASAAQLTQSGSLVYRKGSSVDFYSAPLDPQSGRMITAPTPLRGPGSNNFMARYSPDGRRLVYASEGSPRMIKTFSFDSLREDVVKTSNPINNGYPCWIDNDTIAFNSARQSDLGAGGTVSLNLRTQEERILPSPSGFRMFSCSGKLAAGITVGNQAIAVRNLEDGSERELYRFSVPAQPPLPDPVVSPDGRMLAFFERTPPQTFVLRVVPTNGGEARELARGKEDFRWNRGIVPPRCIAWSPDSRYVYYCRSDSNDVVETFRVPVAGGPSISTGLKGPGAGEIEISPDGTRIISRWGVPGERQLWAMENFLPSGN